MKLFGRILEEELHANSQYKTLPAETVLMESNSHIRSIPGILSGSMRVMRQDEYGREILLYYIKPGESCIMSFLAGIHEDTIKVTLVVEEGSEVLMLPIAKASEWIKVYPDWANFIFKHYHRRFEELPDVNNAVAFQKLDDRIVALLIRKASVYGFNKFSITHQQLAEKLGTTREVISRLLKQMENSNWSCYHQKKAFTWLPKMKQYWKS